ncbi:hypothetical protein Patl1_03306 [Pistacia atlantica]|uniref:Uncharacterized protein n=1 Tax=Pistacia atlantica TaxID=434234 RepID=A0ACC1C5D2_9ROSI|nr:hypothetical protein Patl1_03306 [Pistacia atlantica]
MAVVEAKPGFNNRSNNTSGTYDVILFFPGTSLGNKSYSDLFQHIASHGFIVVAPQLYSCLPPSGNTEVDYAAQIANWLSSGLQSVLPENVEPNLDNLVLSGHSRGGQTAFGLALGYAKTPQVVPQFSAIIGIDPVAGTSKCTALNPPLLSYDSFNFLSSSMPVTVIGTGLGGVTKCVASCAPEGANHEEFYNRCKSTRAHFVATDYGHMDMLDDRPADFGSRVISKCLCTNGKCSRDPMRRCVGGITVAFLKKFVDLDSSDDEFTTIVKNPSLAPIRLDSVEFIKG